MKLFGNDDVCALQRKYFGMLNFLSSRFPFVDVAFLKFDDAGTQDIDSIDRRKWNIVFRLQERCG